jgi:hypothetical protein
MAIELLQVLSVQNKARTSDTTLSPYFININFTARGLPAIGATVIPDYLSVWATRPDSAGGCLFVRSQGLTKNFCCFDQVRSHCVGSAVFSLTVPMPHVLVVLVLQPDAAEREGASLHTSRVDRPVQRASRGRKDPQRLARPLDSLQRNDRLPSRWRCAHCE